MGSIKWRERTPFGDRDTDKLIVDRAAVPGGEDAPLVGVSRAGVASVRGLAATYGPDDLISAWRSHP